MEWVASYPPDLIELVLAVKGPGWPSDDVDLWHRALTPGRKRVRKAVARLALEAVHALTGTLLTQNITLAVRRVR